MNKITDLKYQLISGIKLSGVDLYKIRVGDYRIVYSKEWIIAIQIEKVQKRGRVYRKI